MLWGPKRSMHYLASLKSSFQCVLYLLHNFRRQLKNEGRVRVGAFYDIPWLTPQQERSIKLLLVPNADFLARGFSTLGTLVVMQ